MNGAHTAALQRVAVLVPTLRTSPVVNSILNRATSSAFADVTFPLVCFDAGVDQRLTELPNATVTVAPRPRLGRGWRRAWSTVEGAVAGADLAMVHWDFSFVNVLTVLAARSSGTPVVIVWHSLQHLDKLGRVRTAVNRWLHRNYAGVVGVSPETLDYGARFYRLPAAQSKAGIENAINAARITGLAQAAEPPVTDRPYVIYVGRLSAEKGVDRALRALADVPAARRPVMVVVGTGPELGALLALTRSLGLDGDVVFAGHRSNPYPLMRGSSGVLVPSKLDTCPLVMLEAWCVGAPVIAWDCAPGTVRRIVRERGLGFVATATTEQDEHRQVVEALGNVEQLVADTHPGPFDEWFLKERHGRQFREFLDTVKATASAGAGS